MTQLLSFAAHNLSSMCCARAGFVKAESVVVTLDRTGDHHVAPLRMRPGWGGWGAVRSCRHSVGRICLQKDDVLLTQAPLLTTGDGALHLERRLNRLPCCCPAQTGPSRRPLSVSAMDGRVV